MDYNPIQGVFPLYSQHSWDRLLLLCDSKQDKAVTVDAVKRNKIYVSIQKPGVFQSKIPYSTMAEATLLLSIRMKKKNLAFKKSSSQD